MSRSVLILCGVLLAGFTGCHAGKRVPTECEGQECPADFPIMSYNGTCFCEKHPCMDMSCAHVENTPVLDFAYDKDGVLDCFCRSACPDGVCGGSRKAPQCLGKTCDDPAFPLLTYDEEAGCQCTSHPCSISGFSCEDPAYPMLDFSYNSGGVLDCFCRRDPCEEMSCEDPDFPELAWDQEGNCYCRPYTHEEL